jgi:hypothetical protein
MKIKKRILKEIPAMFIKSFHIKGGENAAGFFYQINFPFLLYIRASNLTITRTMWGLHFQNNQFAAILEIVPQTQEKRITLTIYN